MITKITIFIISLLFILVSFHLKNFLISIGIIFLISLSLSKKVRIFKIPEITAYIITGFLLSPYAFGFISKKDLANFHPIDLIALSLIALTAGGELEISFLKKNIKNIFILSFSQIFICFSGCFALFYLIGKLGFLKNSLIFSNIYAIFFLSLIAIANSPATTIAVINESKLKNYFSQITIGLCILKDFLLILIFSVAISLADLMLHNNFKFSFNEFMLFHFLIPVFISVLLCLIFYLYIQEINFKSFLFLLFLIFLINNILLKYHIDTLNTFLITGFLIRNFTSLGGQLVEYLEKISEPFYIVFFTISAADLPFNYLIKFFIPFALYFIIRTFFTYLSTNIGCNTFKTQKIFFKKYLWLGFLSQAGVSLGFISILSSKFPQWGGELKAVIISYIAVFLLIGPALFRFGLQKSIKMDFSQYD